MPVFGPDQLAPYVAPMPAPAQPGIGAAPYAALLGGQGADLATSLMALQHPNARELNPLGEKGMVIGKVALMAILPYLMKHLAESGHPTAAKVIGYAGGAAGAVPAIHNARVMR